MRVLIVTHYFEPHKGGIEIVALNQARGLVRRGHDVTVLTSAINAPAGTSDLEGIRLVRVPASGVLLTHLGVPFPLFGPQLLPAARQLVGWADVVHVHGHAYLGTVAATVYARRSGTPVVLTQHNTFVHYRSAVLRGIERIADATVGNYSLRRAHRVLAVSQATADYVAQTSGVTAVVHYNGVDIATFGPSADRAALREDLGIPAGAVVALTVRRIVFKNGIDTLLDAVALLRDEPGLVFVLGGRGADLERTRDRARREGLDQLRILGPVSDEELPRWYAAADVFVLPSKGGEGFPLAVCEALAAGTPVVATRSGGHVEILTPELNGDLVEADSPSALADALRSLLRDQRRLAGLRPTSRRFAQEFLSWDVNVTTLEAAYTGAAA